MPTTPIPISALPAPPDRADRSTFSSRAVSMFTALKDVFTPEVNAIAVVTNANAADAAASAADATLALGDAVSAAGNAAVSAANAATAAGAPMWVSGTSYLLGAAVWSPANRVIYRRVVAGAGTTDPSADPANWAMLGTLGLSVVTVTGTSVTAVANGHYVLTNASQTNVTLPAGVSGATVAITCTGMQKANVVTPNGAETIMETAGAMTIDKAKATVTLRYLNSSWRLI